LTDPIVSTKDTPGAFDAFETAKPGEPIFTLQGGDPLAPDLVLAWAKMARGIGMILQDSATTEQEMREAEEYLIKASSAEHIAWSMAEYQAGVLIEQEEQETKPETREALDLQDKRLFHARRLDNAVHEVTLARDFAADHPVEDEVETLSKAQILLRHAASLIRPRRK